MRYVTVPIASIKSLICSYSELSQVLDGLGSLPNLRKKCLQSLNEMCAHRSLIPTALRVELPDHPTDVIRYRGGTAVVLKQNYQGKEVAVKTLRTSASSDSRIIVNVRREVLRLLCNCRHAHGNRRGSARSLCYGTVFSTRTCCSSSE